MQSYGSLDGPQDPLLQPQQQLPPREPSTAESRKLRRRVSVQQRTALQASRRQLMANQGVEGPVMKSLFGKNKNKKRKSVAPSPMNIETLQALVPTGTTDTNNIGQGKTAVVQQQQQPEQAEQNNTIKRHRHSWLYVLLHSKSRHPHSIWYKSVISAIILIDVAFFVASTEQAWSQAHPKLFYYEEGIVSSIFLMEYFCRLYVAPESHKYYNRNNFTPLQARLHYMKSLNALVDAASALPFFLELPTGIKLPNLTWIRFFRLVRILKTGSYARSMETVFRVIYYNSEILYVALNMCILLVLVTAVLMYYLRPQGNANNDVDSDDFSSLLATMYLSTLMLTGQGGPEGDLPWYTKGVILLTGFFSVAMFAIPSSMLTWGFEAEAERCAKKTRQKYVESLRPSPNDNNDNEDDNASGYSNYLSSSSSSEGDTTDEEYLAIIAGGDEEEGEGAAEKKPQDEVVKQLIRTFQTSDVDASGSLSMDEFVELMTDPSLASMSMVGMATSVGLLAKRVHHLEQELTESHRKLDLILQAVRK